MEKLPSIQTNIHLFSMLPICTFLDFKIRWNYCNKCVQVDQMCFPNTQIIVMFKHMRLVYRAPAPFTFREEKKLLNHKF